MASGIFERNWVEIIMDKILSLNQAIKISKELRDKNKKIVLVGGCFDLLHIGHIQLLQKAKEKGDALFVMLEGDKRIRETKGDKRPIHNQMQRAQVLSAIASVDYIILLPYLHTDNEYDQVVRQIHPSIIATTKGDTLISHKNRQAKEIGSTVVFVNAPVKTISTSSILATLLKDNSL